MKRFLSRAWPWALSLLLAVGVWLFWAVGYPHALSYHEQFQLFLFGSDYLSQRLAEPGGLARWLGELLVQFYNAAFVGAAVLALLFLLVQRLTWALMPRRQPMLYALSFLPVAVLWYAMGDDNTMLSYAVALILALACCRVLSRVAGWKNVWAAVLTATVAMPVVYWLVGPLALLPAAFVALVAWQRQRRAQAPLFLLPLLAVVASVVASAQLVPYAPDRLWVGLSYYRFPAVLPLSFVLTPVVVLAVVLLSAVLPRGLSRVAGGVALTAGVAVAGVLLVPRGFDAKRYELIRYDYLVRTGQWRAVIAQAERRQPDLPMSVSATNLALAMEQQLGDRAFQFFQHGQQGLLPPFERNFTTCMLTGEIYWRLGLVNTAQRFAFESMEALPNYNKSVRAVKRLAETNLVNGHYGVARKYLHLLEQTMFYRKWARQTLSLMQSEEAVEAHPVYGRLRRMRLADDFLFSEQEVDKMCGQLFLHNPENSVAMQYLLMSPLMQGDLGLFVQYAQVVQQRVSYHPRHVQEALCYAFAQQRQPLPQGLVSPQVQQDFQRFAAALQRGGRQSEAVLQPFRGTLWYYLEKSR